LKLLYIIFIKLYPFIAQIISVKNDKAKLWIDGRKNIFQRLENTFSNNQSPVVWVHCASLGEFEQGRPIIESIKKNYSSHKILLTFFSPSGYEIRKNYPLADWVFYLPMDGKKAAKRFVHIVDPKLIFFVKYEFWFFYLKEAKRQSIPTLLISANFRANQPFFKWYGSFYRSMLASFTHVFVQNATSKKLLESIGFTNNVVTIHGDTRFDRVIENAAHFSEIPLINSFLNHSKQVIVAGSTWLQDDVLLAEFAAKNKEIYFIIAPHSVEKSRIENCKLLYQQAITFTELQEQKTTTTNVLIIDNVGMLSNLYKYATICYVGGGFTKDGIHNVLEAAVYGKPVIIGPNYKKYTEAVELVAADGVISIKNALELEHQIQELLNDLNKYQQVCKQAQQYVLQKAGATKIVDEYIYENRLLTK